MTEFFWGPEPDGLGPCWDLPGTAIHDNRLKDIRFPTDTEAWDLASARRIFFAGRESEANETYIPLPNLENSLKAKPDQQPSDPETEVVTDVIFEIPNLTWRSIAGYFRSWSGFHNHQKRNPEDQARKARGADGDVVDRFMHRLRSRVPDHPDAVDVQWPVYMMMIRKNGN